jgi:hypothetical protein
VSSKKQRGHNAANLLEDETLKEAFEEMEKFYVGKWRNSSADDDKGWDDRLDAYTMLRAMDAFKAQLTSFVVDGQFAETKLNRHEE